MLYSTILFCVAAFGAALMGVKYAVGPVPAGYHRKILEKDAGISDDLRLVLAALYRVMGGALIGLAVLTAALALGPVAEGDSRAAIAAFAGAAAAAVPAIIVPRQVERASGVRTPWRAGAVLLAIAGAALVLSLL